MIKITYHKEIDMTTALRDFLEIPYDQLEEMNLEAKQQRLDRGPPEQDPARSA